MSKQTDPEIGSNKIKNQAILSYLNLEQNQNILNEIHDAVIATDLNSIIIFWNKGAEKQFGFTSNEIIGKPIYTLYPNESHAYSAEHVIEILRNEGSFEIETTMCRKTKSNFFAHSSLSLLHDDAHDPVGIISYSLDITEKKWAEKILSIEKYIFEYATSEYDLTKCLDFINRSVEKLLPESISSICLVDPDNQNLHHGSAPSLSEKYTKLIDGMKIGPNAGSCGTAVYRKERVIVKDISTDPLWKNTRIANTEFGLKSCWSTPIITTKNQVLGTFAVYYKQTKTPSLLDIESIDRLTNIARVIIESKRSEIALIENENRFRGLVTNIPGAVYRCACDKDWTMNYISKNIKEISGYDNTDFINNDVRTFASIIHPEDKKLVDEQVQRGIDSREPFIIEYRIIHQNGDVRWVYEKGQGVFNENHELEFLDGVVFDITESHELTEKLNFYASHDLLTGLINRREFELRLQRVLDTSQAGTSDHALCYMDLDQFKIINDTCGHIAGDNLLSQLSVELSKHIRKRDTFARLGGDEFGLLMEHCSVNKAKSIANKLRKAVSNYQFIWENRSFNVGVSIGLVPINNTSGNISNVLKEADTACYAAKDAGRNRVHVYHPEDIELAKRHGEMLWVTRINEAIEENRLFIYFQPIEAIRNITAGKHIEVLIRMKDEDEIILPGYFLPAAERYNLSTKIDRWVVKETFRLLNLDKEYLRNLYLCGINLSGHSLADNKFLQQIIEEFKKTKIPPEKICFEITETAAIANFSKASTFINVLRNLGCKFALDDFGSGLSSFAYLKNLSVDFLKIDGMFVKDIDKDPIDYAMVKSINEIGQVMGKKTIAEFVEDKIILDKLKFIGVDYAQGYGIGEPMEFNPISLH